MAIDKKSTPKVAPKAAEKPNLRTKPTKKK